MLTDAGITMRRLSRDVGRDVIAESLEAKHIRTDDAPRMSALTEDSGDDSDDTTDVPVDSDFVRTAESWAVIEPLVRAIQPPAHLGVEPSDSAQVDSDPELATSLALLMVQLVEGGLNPAQALVAYNSLWEQRNHRRRPAPPPRVARLPPLIINAAAAVPSPQEAPSPHASAHAPSHPSAHPSSAHPPVSAHPQTHGTAAEKRREAADAFKDAAAAGAGAGAGMGAGAGVFAAPGSQEPPRRKDSLGTMRRKQFAKQTVDSRKVRCSARPAASLARAVQSPPARQSRSH
jgi:hypothetical protein